MCGGWKYSYIRIFAGNDRMNQILMCLCVCGVNNNQKKNVFIMFSLNVALDKNIDLVFIFCLFHCTGRENIVLTKQQKMTGNKTKEERKIEKKP